MNINTFIQSIIDNFQFNSRKCYVSYNEFLLNHLIEICDRKTNKFIGLIDFEIEDGTNVDWDSNAKKLVDDLVSMYDRSTVEMMVIKVIINNNGIQYHMV